MNAKILYHLAWLAVAFFPFATASATKYDIWNPSTTVLAQLPQYCWSQYREDFRKQTGIKSPVEMCGHWMNHFCPGLVYMMSARDPSNPKGDRLVSARKALDQVNYTIKGMPAGCALTEDVQAAKIRAETLIKVLK